MIRRAIVLLLVGCYSTISPAVSFLITRKPMTKSFPRLEHERTFTNRQQYSTTRTRTLSQLSESRRENDLESNARRGTLRQRLKILVSRAASPLLGSILTVLVGFVIPLVGFRSSPALAASAPVMALPKTEDMDPAQEAMKRHEKSLSKKMQLELDEMARKARQIEATQGPAARANFEKEYKLQKQLQAQQKAEGLIQLKRDLLDQGIDPFCDMEGQRQVILYDRGLDLSQVGGTPFAVEKMYQEKNPQKSLQFRKAPHRQIIQLMVQDLKNQNRDPLEYFESHKDQTLVLLDVPIPKALAVLERYKTNMEQYGQLIPPRPGELSYKEKLAAAVTVDPDVQQQIAKKRKLQEKADAEAEKQRLKAQAKAAKEETKQKKLAEKEKANAAKKAAATAAAAASALASKAAAAAAASASVVAAEVATQVLPEPVSTISDIVAPSSREEISDDLGKEDADIGGNLDKITDLPIPKPIPKPSVGVVAVKPSPKQQQQQVSTQKNKVVDILPVSAFLVTAGAGAYGFKIYREREAEKEEERQRQFRLLMQGTGVASSSAATKTPAVEEMDDSVLEDVTPANVAVEDKSPLPSSVGTKATPPPKARRLGIFKSKKDGRETDLRALVGPDAEAPQFASLLGKILTFGAPGRFPNALAILGSDSPLEQFDLEKAKTMLIEARLSAGLDVSQSAEIFANVVNCMLIEIVDLASSSLKEKEKKLILDAINIVVDFMNHAASLYEAVAEGVTITPVTYSGNLAKSKLEQMYSQYAVGGMMNSDGVADDFESRVALLQDVFAINEKKAEGLMLKAMQKNMMEMMKNGGEGMSDMMKNMGLDSSLMGGGADGMNGEGMDPEQLKTMLLELKSAKDRGEISKEEMNMVRSQFKQAFGSSIDDLLKQADSASPEDREVLDLMKSVLE